MAIPPAPGSMTVPLMHGWEGIVVVLVVAAVLGVAFLVLDALSKDGSGASEWQAFLDARSRTPGDVDEPATGPVRSDSAR